MNVIKAPAIECVNILELYNANMVSNFRQNCYLFLGLCNFGNKRAFTVRRLAFIKCLCTRALC